MDRYKGTADIIRDYYLYKRTGNNADFVKRVCEYFDRIKSQEINGADLNFLSFLANESGIPHYYDMLFHIEDKNEIGTLDNISLGMLSSFFNDASLCLDSENSKLHRFQKQILDNFTEKKNRYILTAPTSFGKTFIIYQIIKKRKYSNILLVFPTISLLNENYQRVMEMQEFKDYHIHTLSEETIIEGEKNLFIYTPERFLSFLDANTTLTFEFSFIDEIYKIDNGYLIDEDEEKENERDIAYRLALEYICLQSKDVFLAGPYITLKKENSNKSFEIFAEQNNFQVLQYNEYEIVSKHYYDITQRGTYNVDGHMIKIPNKKKYTLLIQIITGLSSPDENTIIYCGRKIDTERYAKKLLENPEVVEKFYAMYTKEKDDIYSMFVEHLEITYGSEWIVVVALKARIGIHHGLIPKYIQKEIINLFNSGQLICLFSTTTITEGVNTPAKNMVITSVKKGIKDLKQFDAKNIAGRAGRFGNHYSGRVIDISAGFINIINGENEILQHKNYDITAPKSDIDYQITKNEYLSIQENMDKDLLNKKAQEMQIPNDILSKFKVIGPRDKIDMYVKISELSAEEKIKIDNLINTVFISKGKNLNWDGFQVILNLIEPFVKNNKLKFQIEYKIITKKKSEYSLLIFLLQSYLDNGFMGMVKYQIENRGERIDNAMRKVAETVYNTFKYQLVKYLGGFDVIYRFIKSKEKNCSIDQVKSIGYLLQKLEYNATTEKAKKVSDFGAPYNIIRKYENPDLIVEYDAYEKYVDSQVKRLLSKE